METFYNDQKKSRKDIQAIKIYITLNTAVSKPLMRKQTNPWLYISISRLRSKVLIYLLSFLYINKTCRSFLKRNNK